MAEIASKRSGRPKKYLTDAEKIDAQRQRYRKYYANNYHQRQAHSERLKEYRKNYYARKKLDPEWVAKKNAYSIKYCREHKDILDKWKNDHPEWWRTRAKKNPARAIWLKVKNRANSRGIDFNIEETDIIIPKTCPVLGIPIVPFQVGLQPTTPSVDRVDPDKGYLKGNIRVISWRANDLKRDCKNPAELRAVADYIEENLSKKVDGMPN